MRTPVVLVTGAAGEIGQALIERLSEDAAPIVSLDLLPLPGALARRVHRAITGSILDAALLDRMLAEYEIDRMFHLAALLSTRSEFSPLAAHQVNVGGTLHLLEFARRQTESHGRPVVFLYPSSIAAYGLPTLDDKQRTGAVAETAWTQPITMYGCNKLYCEHLGRYYASHYKQLSAEGSSGAVDFRAVRFPGLISASTLPSGGTSDYAPEMIHAAARGARYACFVRPDTRIPFMAMPDAVNALITLAAVARERLTTTVYNVRAFAPSADDIRSEVLHAFPRADIIYSVDEKRQRIVDSWPEDLDDRRARRDWGFAPAFDFERTFRDYLRQELLG
jgi:nucleoside-diphosphate-sugar epimerase